MPAGLGAVTTVLGGGGFVVLFGISGFLETQVWTEDPKKEPGNFGDPVGLGMYDVDMRNKELNYNTTGAPSPRSDSKRWPKYHTYNKITNTNKISNTNK